MPQISARLVAFAGSILFVSALVSAQAPAPARGAAPPAPTNLQFLPKDIARADLLATMQALGSM